MTDLSTILKQEEIKSVLVVDDAYDKAPRANDLTFDAEAWTHFFDDLTEDDEKVLIGLFPNFEDTRPEDLKASDIFISLIWQHRKDIREELISPLFSRYDTDTLDDLQYLSPLLENLESLNLTPTTSGRQFAELGLDADLIIIDLYLSSAQGVDDINIAIDSLSSIISKRKKSPPLVILMSRSSRLESKRDFFRDNTGLFESGFRVVPKRDLTDQVKLSRIILRLARHHKSTIKLSNFSNAWKNSLDSASGRVTDQLRKLNISDYAQMHNLLLDEEGESIGNYLVDVFDKIFIHELEKEEAIVKAAKELNSINLNTYPSPYIGASPDLQTLVGKLIFQNKRRITLSETGGLVVSFGDVLRIKDPQNQVMIVLSPACDLQRQEATTVMLMVGELTPLKSHDWSKNSATAKTPIIELDDGTRFWIKWNLKHIEALSFTDLKDMFNSKTIKKIARMRDTYALELQQKLLSTFGRVGQTATMPATFPIAVTAYVVQNENIKKPTLLALDLPILKEKESICFIGRNDGLRKIIIPEECCEAICDALCLFDSNQIHANARDITNNISKTDVLLEALERGIELPDKEDTFKPFKSIPQDKEAPTDIGYIIRCNEPGPIDKQKVKNAGIILAVSFIE